MVVQFNGSDNSYFLSQQYTISSADTWERKSITIPGDTTGTWMTNKYKKFTNCMVVGCGQHLFWNNTTQTLDRNSATGANLVF